jgi:2-oxoglutarate ferredoxin oxidoreductase subunit gamma
VRKEVRLSGFGGQGIGLAGLLLGHAITLYDDLEAVMTQSYGPEARGGASSADVIVSDQPIDYPFVQQPDFLVALSQEAYSKFSQSVKEGALILIDEELVSQLESDNCYGIPATRLAEKLGRRIVTNVVMLGYFSAVTGLVSRKAVESALEDILAPKILPLNLKAFAAGYEYPTRKETARKGLMRE